MDKVSGRVLTDRAGGPSDLSRCASQPVGAHPSRVQLAGCCRRCTEAAVVRSGGDAMDFRLQRMFLCSTCGNKRCPHASDHRHACTGSNVSGQAGSDYGSETLDRAGVIDLIGAHGREHGSVSAWAIAKGIHPEIALSVWRGSREPATTILAALSLRKIISYAPLASDSDGNPKGRDGEAGSVRSMTARAEGIAQGEQL